MLKQKLFLEQFILIIIIAVLHFFALQFYLYWTFEWFDILLHFLGGLWVGLVALWFFFFSGFVYKDVSLVRKTRIFLITIASVLTVGVLWEVWEVWANLVFIDEQGYFLDTALDLVMDTLGAVIAFIYAKKLIRQPAKKNNYE